MLSVPSSTIAEVFHTVMTRIDFSLPTYSSAYNIEKLLNQTVLHGGKRFRPTFLILFGKFLGLECDSLIPYARAAELAHAATLAHDDVIDEAKMRRSAQTLNAVASNAHAVLGGDFLLARVIAEISSLGELAIIQDMADVLEQLVSGEWMQLEARGMIRRSPQDLEAVAKRKTASLIGWCCGTPARLARVKPETRDLCREFGVQVGIAFQQVDDLLDFEMGTGKPFAQDYREGLINFVAAEYLTLYPQRRDRIASGLGSGSPWPPHSGNGDDPELAHSIVNVRENATQRIAAAQALLDRISEELLKEDIAVDLEAQAGLVEVLSGILSRNK